MPTSSLRIYRRLLSYVSRYWLAFAIGIVATLLSSGTDAAFTWFLKPVLDKGFIAREQGFIQWLPVIIFSAFLIRGIAGFTSNYCMTYAARNVVMRFRQAMFNHLLKLPASYYDSHSSGQILSTLLYNVEQIAKASTDALVTVVQESCFVIGLIVVMLMTSWQLSLLFLLTAPFITLTARQASKKMRRLSSQVQNSMGEITHIAEEAIEGYKVVRTFGGEDYEQAKFTQATDKNRQRELKVVATNSLATALVQQVAGCAIAIIFFLATAKNAHITAGGFASMLAAMLAILKPLKNLTTISSTVQKGIAAAASIFELLDQLPEPDTGHIAPKQIQGAIRFKEVYFAYNVDKPILQNIELTIAAGQTVALVGRSGSGKTTLVNLLPRFYDNYQGLISIDELDIRQYPLAALRRQIAYVSQHVTLFNDTIANNIAYGSSHKSLAEIEQAAIAAHAMEFIQQLPQGFDTLVGENGVLLSGGQRQRLAIARALLKDAPILILDEATSALDTESERHIQAALINLIRNRTTLVIAHRLSTIEHADNIIVLDQGRIVESGTHHALLALDQHYARLYRMQFKDDETLA